MRPRPSRSPRGTGSAPARSAACRSARPRRRAFPRLVAERMRNPRVAAIGVVLDDDERAARPEVRGQRPDHDDLPVARHEVEAVRGDEAVEPRAASSGRREVGDERRPARRRETARRRPRRWCAAPRVAVDRDDPAAGSEQVGERQRERARSRRRCPPRSRPASTAARSSATWSRVIHGA